jgi:hypothetical protein
MVHSSRISKTKALKTLIVLCGRQVFLDHVLVPIHFYYTHLLDHMHACVYSMMGPKTKDMPCTSLTKPRLFTLCWVALLVAYTFGLWLVNLKQMLLRTR